MRNRALVSIAAFAAFVATAGMSPGPSHVSFPGLAYASGSCGLATLVCANDSSPGCETICGGEEQAVCVEGSCSAAGNVLKPNRCGCK
jgi:hypothetical protein